MFSVAYAADAPWNDSHWKNKHFNQMLKQARAELDQTKRKALYAEMQSLVKDDGGTIVPMFNQMVEAHSKKISHDTISGHMEMDGHRNTERMWFTK